VADTARPHGSDWLCEAALDTYLPLLEVLRGLAAHTVPAPVTIGFTPVLANQLTNPLFVTEMHAFFAQRLEACDQGDGLDSDELAEDEATAIRSQVRPASVEPAQPAIDTAAIYAARNQNVR
jgi:predicted glycosyl hydrolase (DUF1957 family)